MTAHQETAYNFRNVELPTSENLRDNSIIVPLYHPMTEDQTSRVINNINNLLG